MNKIRTYPTPNPQAIKFLFDKPISHNQKYIFTKDSAPPLEWLQNLFNEYPLHEVTISDNFITATLTQEGSWKTLHVQFLGTLLSLYDLFDGDLKIPPKPDTRPLEIRQIDEIITRTVRSYLQSDGGDLECVKLEGKTLTIRYLGNCASCPSSLAGTSRLITNALKQNYDKDIEIQIIP